MPSSNEPIFICFVNCSHLGHRRTIAYHTLEETGPSNMHRMAVCDNRRENRERVAGESNGCLAISRSFTPIWTPC